MFPFKILTALAFATLALAQHMKMVPAPFNATAYDGLISCVGNASSKYHVAIHHGTIVIIPPPGQRIDLDTTDTALDACLARFTSCLSVEVHYDRTHVDGDGAANAALADASAEWAEANGARGMSLEDLMSFVGDGVEANGAPGSSSMLPRGVSTGQWYTLGDKCNG